MSFEVAHTEWLSLGGPHFRELYRFGPRPDFYRSRYWQLVKEAVLSEKCFKCCRCGADATYVHHLNYEHVGEDHLHPETLMAICGPCHCLVEYARNAESLISRIYRRISLCEGFLEGRGGCLDQNATHLYTRLLQYREELAELRNKFISETPYRNPPIKNRAEEEAVIARLENDRHRYETQAQIVVSKWKGNEKAKAQKLLPMLESEIQACKAFVAEVLAPVPIRADRVAPERFLAVLSGDKPVECLVVGIKFHRGHVKGISCGDSIKLTREPNNAYDPNAIQVSLSAGELVGYLTKEVARPLAREMDAGNLIRGHVSRIVRDKLYITASIINERQGVAL